MPDSSDYSDYSNGPEDSEHSFDVPASDWDSDEALAALKLERDVRGDGAETNEQMARRIIEEAAPVAATKIVWIAMHAQNDNTALAASKYIMDLTTGEQTDQGKAAWEKFVADAVSEVELHANADHG